MTSLMTKKNKNIVSSAQKTFNRLRNKISKLQVESTSIEKMLDEALTFYHTAVRPAILEETASQTEFIKVLFKIYKNPPILKPNQVKDLKNVILNMITNIFNAIGYKDADPKLEEIYKELEGYDVRDEANEEMHRAKEDMKSLFREHGVDIDLSNI